MATHKNHETLKRQAIENLAASRMEISTEMQSLRSTLNPKAVMHRAVDGHKGAVVATAIGAAAAVSLLIYHRRHSARSKAIRMPLRERRPAAEPGITSHILRLLAGALVPALIKSIVTGPLADLHKPSASPDVE